MRKVYGAIILVALSAGTLPAQSRVLVGIEGGTAIPVGITSDHYGIGFGAGAFVIIPTTSEMVSVMLGADYLNMPGKTKTETIIYNGPDVYGYETRTTTYHDLQAGSLYAGPKIGEASGPYFLPALSLNYALEVRLGLYVGAGYLIQFESVGLNIGAKYGILNLVGRDGDEDLDGGIGIFVGVVF
jgi:hypothetical protein